MPALQMVISTQDDLVTATNSTYTTAWNRGTLPLNLALGPAGGDFPRNDTLFCVDEDAQKLYKQMVRPEDSDDERKSLWKYCVTETARRVGLSPRFNSSVDPPPYESEEGNACALVSGHDDGNTTGWTTVGPTDKELAEKEQLRRKWQEQKNRDMQVDAIHQHMMRGRTDSEFAAGLASIMSNDPEPNPKPEPKPKKKAPTAPWAEAEKPEMQQPSILDVATKKGTDEKLVLFSKRCHDLVVVRLAPDAAPHRKWLVDTQTGMAVPLNTKIPSYTVDAFKEGVILEDFLVKYGQKATSKSRGVVETVDTPGGPVCAVGALGISMDAKRCACHGLKEPLDHEPVAPHHLAPRVVLTACTHLGLPVPPVSTHQSLGLGTMSRAKKRSIRDQNLGGPQSSDTKWMVDLRTLIACVQRNTKFLDEVYLGEITNDGFHRVVVGFMDDAAGCRNDTLPKKQEAALRGIINLAQKLYSRHRNKSKKKTLEVSPREMEAIRAVLGQWPCEVNCRHHLENGGDCNDNHCCMVHLDKLREKAATVAEFGEKALQFGFEVNGWRRLYCKGLQNEMEKVLPVACISTTDLKPLFIVRTPSVQEVHPSLVQFPTPAPPARVKRPPRKVEHLSPEEKAHIVAANTPEAAFESAVLKIINHPQVDDLKARVNRKMGESLDDEGFREWVKQRLSISDGEEWFHATLFVLDDHQGAADAKAKRAAERAAIRQQRLDDNARIASTLDAVRAKRT